jgi:hypothetical protein
VSIFTACCWIGERNVHSAVVVSDNLTHDKETSAISMILVLKHFLSLLHESSTKTLQIFTDGPTSQFKNRFMFTFLTLLRSHFMFHMVEWNFFAASHGKGPVDGVGAASKRIVWQAVRNRHFLVKDAASFFGAFAQLNNKIHIVLNTEDLANQISAKLNLAQEFNNSPAIHGIYLDHYWKCDTSGSIRCDSSCQIKSNAEAETIVEYEEITLDYETPLHAFTPGKVVCVRLQAKHGRKLYLAVIIDIDEHEKVVQLSYLRQQTKHVYVYPKTPDLSWEPFNSITVSIEQPHFDNRGRYMFQNNPLHD